MHVLCFYHRIFTIFFFLISRIRGAARRTGQRSLNVLRRAGGAVGRMASATDRNLRGLARTANRGLFTLKKGGVHLIGHLCTYVVRK